MPKAKPAVIIGAILAAGVLGAMAWALWSIVTIDMFPAVDFDAMYLSEEGGRRS